MAFTLLPDLPFGARAQATAVANPWLRPRGARIHTPRSDTHGRPWPNSEARQSLRIDLNNARHRHGNRNTERYELIDFRAAVSLALNY
jgi:hypothetical protein